MQPLLSAHRVLFPLGEMALPLETLRELVKLSGLRTKILDRRFDVLKNHVTDGNFLTSDEREALDLVCELRELHVFSSDEYDEQIDAQILGIVGTASPPPPEEESDGLLRTKSAAAAAAVVKPRASQPVIPEREGQAGEKPGNLQTPCFSYLMMEGGIDL